MGKYPVSLICKVLGIRRSSYYNRKKNPQTRKESKLLEERRVARVLFEENESEYGRERLHKAFTESGYSISKGKVRTLMLLEKLVPKRCKKYKATTNSKHKYPVCENILNRDFNAEKPNQKWCGDSTYIYTEEGWLYAAGIIDLCSRDCVGLSFSSKHTQELMLEALNTAYREYKPNKGLIFHSDRGVQYASNAYKKQLKAYGMEQSMSRSGVPYDNAPMESFWSTVKFGCILGRKFKTRKEAEQAVFEYVFGFYNTRRYHSNNGYVAPSVHRANMLKTA